jgi:hypothetical protein
MRTLSGAYTARRLDFAVSVAGCGALASLRLVTAKRSLPVRRFILPDFERFQSRDYAIQLLLSGVQFLEHPEHALLKRVHMAIINRVGALQIETDCAKCFKNDVVTGRTASLWNSANKEVSACGGQW